MEAQESGFVREPTDPEAVLDSWLSGRHPLMRRLRDDIQLHARGILSILILGEPGTGKERVARALHALSGRNSEPFIAINLAAISGTLLESELFGHEKGAFTGAETRRIGHFERAANGMLFLDEIGDAPAHTQVRMLRAMDPGEFTRVGGSETILMRARIVAATNSRPEEKLRADFLDRVAGIRLYVPPLRDRLSDLPALASGLLAEHAERTGSTARVVSDAGLSLLRVHDWPDNVRGLKRVLWQCAAWVRGDELQDADIKRAMEGPERGCPTSATRELDRFREVLREERGVVTHAAGRVGLKRTQFYQRMKALGLDPNEFRATEHVRSKVFGPNTSRSAP